MAVAEPGWRLAEVALIGAGWQEPLFGSVRQIGFGAPGQLLVLDGRSAEVTVTDLGSGKLLRRVGKAGPGPGEFLGPTLLAAASSGEFAVLDRDSGARVSRFSDTGEFRGVTDVSDTLPHLVRKIAVTESGVYVLAAPASSELRRSDRVRHPRLTLLRSTDAGKLAVAPELVFDWAELGLEPMQARDPAGPIPFNVEPRALWSLLHDGRHAVARSDRYEIAILAPDGRKIGSLRRDLEPRPITTADKERVLSSMTPALRQLGAEFGECMPLILDVYPGPSGSILVHRGSDEGAVIDVFSSSFELVDEVALPEGFRLMAARDGLLAGAVTTADEETAVKVLRLER